MQALRKFRRPLAAGAVFLACLLVFAVFWQLQVREAAQKSRSVYLNDVQDSSAGPVAEGGQLEQLFTSEKAFHALGVVPLFEGESPAGILVAEVYDVNGQLLARAEGNARETLSGSYAFFVFPKAAHTAEGVYRLVFSAALEDGRSLSLAASGVSPEGWQLAENGSPVAGALCLSAAVDAIGGFIGGFYAVFAVAASAAVAAVFFLALGKRMAFHRVFAVAAVCLGLLYCFILPPYSTPDEQFHINQSFNISSSLLGQAPEGGIPWGSNIKREGDYNPQIQDQFTTVFTYREIAREFFTRAPSSAPATFSGEEVGGYRLLYWPSALMITVARLLGLGFVQALFLGRLANLSLYILLCTLAVKLVPRGKSIFAVVAMLPMSMHLAASFSRDALTLALYFFFTALCLYYIDGKATLDWKQLLCLGLLVVVTAPAKIVYVPLLLLCLFIPGERFFWQGRAMGKQLALAVRWGLVTVGLLSLLAQGGVAMMGNAMGVPQPEAAPSTPGAISAQAALPAGLVAQDGAEAPATLTPAPIPQQDSETFTLTDFFRHPGTMVMLVVRTVAQDLTFWLQGLVGGNLSYFTLPLNWGFVVALTLLLAAAALPGPASPTLGRRLTLAAGLMVLAGVGLVVLGCITWTPTYYKTIYGIQGRYFLPLLPLGLCALASAQKAVTHTRPLERELTFATMAVSVFALLNAFLLVLTR